MPFCKSIHRLSQNDMGATQYEVNLEIFVKSGVDLYLDLIIYFAIKMKFS